MDRFLAPFTVAPFGGAEAARYGELSAALERSGTPIGELDTQMAAHALTLGVTLVTNNHRHFNQIVHEASRLGRGGSLERQKPRQ
jgi:tRNA(fMet)-specific endonuclease VapC